ncbi:MAG: DoxX family protein [Tepidisphaerales bacterium]
MVWRLAAVWRHAADVRLWRLLAALMFALAGLSHFLFPELFARTIPPWIPFPRFWVAFTGVAELVGAWGLLTCRLRRAAGWGLMLLLVCVLPAHWHVATHPQQFAEFGLPGWAYWARMLLQPVLVAWVWWVAVRRPSGRDDA